MNQFEIFIKTFYYILTEPACNINLPLDVPFPPWLLGAILLLELLRGSIRTVRDLMWNLALMIVASRFELLTIVVLVPYVTCTVRTWGSTPEYGYAFSMFLLWISYLSINIVWQLQDLSPLCYRKVQQSFKGIELP